MKTSQAGIDIIKEFEGFSATRYLCPAGVPRPVFAFTREPVARADLGIVASAVDGQRISMADRTGIYYFGFWRDPHTDLALQSDERQCPGSNALSRDS